MNGVTQVSDKYSRSSALLQTHLQAPDVCLPRAGVLDLQSETAPCVQAIARCGAEGDVVVQVVPFSEFKSQMKPSEGAELQWLAGARLQSEERAAELELNSGARVELGGQCGDLCDGLPKLVQMSRILVSFAVAWIFVATERDADLYGPQGGQDGTIADYSQLLKDLGHDG